MILEVIRKTSFTVHQEQKVVEYRVAEDCSVLSVTHALRSE